MTCKITKYLTPERKKIPDLGQSALISGASSGLGRELAILFSRTGHVILSGRNAEELNKTRLQCRDPHNTTTVCGDLQRIEIIQQLASSADLYGIKYLVCCAGQYLYGKLTENSQLDIQNLLHSNLTSTISLIHAVYPHLLDSTIVHINSIAGKSTQSTELVYSASKSGMTAFLRGLRFEAREKGIRVLDVFPGAIQTPMNVNSTGNANRPGMLVAETAMTIYTVATMLVQSLQIEELHIGRFPA